MRGFIFLYLNLIITYYYVIRETRDNLYSIAEGKKSDTYQVGYHYVCVIYMNMIYKLTIISAIDLPQD